MEVIDTSVVNVRLRSDCWHHLAGMGLVEAVQTLHLAGAIRLRCVNEHADDAGSPLKELRRAAADDHRVAVAGRSP